MEYAYSEYITPLELLHLYDTAEKILASQKEKLESQDRKSI